MLEIDGWCVFLSAKRGRMDGLAMGRFSQGSEMKGGWRDPVVVFLWVVRRTVGWKSTWLMGSMGSRIWGGVVLVTEFIWLLCWGGRDNWV